MRKFNLDEWLQDKSQQVITRGGDPVQIIDYQVKGNHCIYAKVTEEDGETFNLCTTADGEAYVGEDTLYDLFFADNELTEFENAVLSVISDHYGHKDSIEAFAKRNAKKLLELAREQLEPEFEEELDRAYKNADKVQYERGRQSVLESLPVWEREPGIFYNGSYIFNDAENRELLVTSGWSIPINRLLESLPKIRED